MDAATPAPAAGGRVDLLAACRTGRARLGFALGLVAIGDWVLTGSVGTILVLFVFASAVACGLANPRRAGTRTSLIATAALLLGSLPLVEDVDALPILFSIAGLAIFALLLAGPRGRRALDLPLDGLRLLVSGPLRLITDAAGTWRAADATGLGRHLALASLLGWIVPLGLLAAFGILFADANPILRDWLDALDPARAQNLLDPWRIALWVLLLAFVWPLLHVRLKSRDPAEPKPAVLPGADPSLVELLLSREAILRSLVLFNLLFAVQTGLDALYLWGGISLPAGTTYAAYAHRGAYPLLVTTLLAATFVLAAMRPGGAEEGSPLVRRLVLLFLAQNVGLVLSSILRLDLYVSVYSLTHWRLAAFVWMGLVAIGLVLIGLRIALRRSNRWLIGTNLAVAAATLWVCCFVNVPAVIADYNVQHEATAQRLDVAHLRWLGPQAIPAIDQALLVPDGPHVSCRYYVDTARRACLLGTRHHLVRAHRAETSDWRAWTLRNWRLSRYLDRHPAPPTPAIVPVPGVEDPASSR